METLLVLVVLLGLVGCSAAPDDEPGPLHVTGMWVTVPRQLSPRADTNPLTVSYWLEVEGRPQVLRLRPRKGLASQPFTLVTYSEDGARREEHVYVQDNCFYQGEVQGSPGSLVALGTCGRGLRGVLWMEGSTYEIEPIPDDPAFQHMLYRMEADSDPMGPTCGLTPAELQYQKTVLPWLQAPRTEEKYVLKDWWTHTRRLSSFIVTFVHELGHNLGMRHDERHCKCRRKRCIMYETESDTDAFSDCSYKDYFDLLGTGGSCLRQSPALGSYYTLKREYCGNKIVESGEQCDCGSKSDCRNDPCCHPNCTLTAGSVCASGKCCKGCQILPAGTLCRARTGNCDLPEYCNGTSPWCKPDVYVQDGAPCEDGAYCYKGKCSSHGKQCKHLFGKQARPAPLDCFKEVNSRGDRFGNCGIRNGVHFIKCSVENALCGRLQCENIHKLPPLQNHITVIQTPVGGKKCWGLDYHIGMPVADSGAVEDGTTCGSNKICIERTCTNISVLNYDCNITKCHNRGVCNNLRNCHCEYGWAPPYCEREGFGGSIDSGPPPAKQIFQRSRIGLVGLVFPVVLGVILALYYKKEIGEWIMRERPDSTGGVSGCFKYCKCQ
ncbi:disintegrin and metalloproteinase domain-containing protein 21-like isoform X2 [Phasianus colchicus]|uniref:disintegrin and metalloproteinase domain-containing protein 21-like isoform X2 n=1 Tax=Phasianus colchicus TaxID=9054 RepID=UPI00129E67D9|nr:disintegrin and metalloproteinase domain-containing protein 21-like isoform X2 [Phasianus colchicus]